MTDAEILRALQKAMAEVIEVTASGRIAKAKGMLETALAATQDQPRLAG